MAREIVFGSKFKRNIKQHYLALAGIAWAEILYHLAHDWPLPDKYRDHALSGEWAGCRDYHVKPDLVLIYEKIDNDLVLIRPGTHAELFG